MEPLRKQALRKSLREQAESQGTVGSRERLSWLCRQLQEYVDRWAGFVALESIPMPNLIASEHFGMIEIGAEMVGEEMASGHPPALAADAWPGVVATLRRLRRGDGNSSEVERLEAAIERLSKAL
jgi:hypothetical protein